MLANELTGEMKVLILSGTSNTVPEMELPATQGKEHPVSPQKDITHKITSFEN